MKKAKRKYDRENKIFLYCFKDTLVMYLTQLKDFFKIIIKNLSEFFHLLLL